VAVAIGGFLRVKQCEAQRWTVRVLAQGKKGRGEIEQSKIKIEEHDSTSSNITQKNDLSTKSCVLSLLGNSIQNTFT